MRGVYSFISFKTITTKDIKCLKRLVEEMQMTVVVFVDDDDVCEHMLDACVLREREKGGRKLATEIVSSCRHI